MVDQNLLDKLKLDREHPESASYDSYLLLSHIFKQLSEENDELKKKIEGLDLCLQFIIVEGGEEIYKYWSSIRDNKVDFDEGEGPRVTATLKGSRELFGGILDKKFDYLDALKAGDLELFGNQKDIYKYGQILLFVGDILDDLLEKIN